MVAAASNIRVLMTDVIMQCCNMSYYIVSHHATSRVHLHPLCINIYGMCMPHVLYGHAMSCQSMICHDVSRLSCHVFVYGIALYRMVPDPITLYRDILPNDTIRYVASGSGVDHLEVSSDIVTMHYILSTIYYILSTIYYILYTIYYVLSSQVKPCPMAAWSKKLAHGLVYSI